MKKLLILILCLLLTGSVFADGIGGGGVDDDGLDGEGVSGDGIIAAESASTGDALLLETGDYLLLESL